MRRVGHREAAPLAVLHEDVDVLAGEELQALAGGQLEVEHRHVFRRFLHLLHAGGKGADGEVLRARELAHLEDNVGHGPRAAGERLARRLLVRMQRALLVIAVRELSGAQHALAGAACAVAASIRQADSLAQCAFQDGLAGSDGERVPAGFEPNLVAGRWGFRQWKAFVGAAGSGIARTSRTRRGRRGFYRTGCARQRFSASGGTRPRSACRCLRDAKPSRRRAAAEAAAA